MWNLFALWFIQLCCKFLKSWQWTLIHVNGICLAYFALTFLATTFQPQHLFNHNIFSTTTFQVLDWLFLEWKKDQILPASWHNENRFNLQNVDMDLFPIILKFVNFMTWVSLSIPLYKGSLLKCIFFLVSKIDVNCKMDTGHWLVRAVFKLYVWDLFFISSAVFFWTELAMLEIRVVQINEIIIKIRLD